MKLEHYQIITNVGFDESKKLLKISPKPQPQRTLQCPQNESPLGIAPTLFLEVYDPKIVDFREIMKKSKKYGFLFAEL